MNKKNLNQISVNSMFPDLLEIPYNKKIFKTKNFHKFKKKTQIRKSNYKILQMKTNK